MGKCVIKIPKVSNIMFMIKVLARSYPEDNIVLINKSAIEAAINTSKYEARYRSGSCLDKKVAVGARLFYELIQLHPLSDGNKRLAAYVLATYLYKNKLTIKKSVLKDLALKVARGEISFEGVYRCLRRHVRRRS